MFQKKSFNFSRHASEVLKGNKFWLLSMFRSREGFDLIKGQKSREKIQDGGMGSCHLKKLTSKTALSAK